MEQNKTLSTIGNHEIIGEFPKPSSEPFATIPVPNCDADGIVISDMALEKFNPLTFEQRSVGLNAAEKAKLDHLEEVGGQAKSDALQVTGLLDTTPGTAYWKMLEDTAEKWVEFPDQSKEGDAKC